VGEGGLVSYLLLCGICFMMDEIWCYVCLCTYRSFIVFVH
jgi:hypothetical protein